MMEGRVLREEFDSQAIFWLEAVCLQNDRIEFGVEFEWAGGFVEVFVIEFGDAALLCRLWLDYWL